MSHLRLLLCCCAVVLICPPTIPPFRSHSLPLQFIIMSHHVTSCHIMSHHVTGRQSRTAGRRAVVHLDQAQVDGPRRLPDGPNRSQDSPAVGAGVVAGVLDAPVQLEQRELGRHGRDRHHGGELFTMHCCKHVFSSCTAAVVL